MEPVLMNFCYLMLPFLSRELLLTRHFFFTNNDFQILWNVKVYPFYSLHCITNADIYIYRTKMISLQKHNNWFELCQMFSYFCQILLIYLCRCIFWKMFFPLHNWTRTLQLTIHGHKSMRWFLLHHYCHYYNFIL